jgi:hypothetical protein
VTGLCIQTKTFVSQQWNFVFCFEVCYVKKSAVFSPFDAGSEELGFFVTACFASIANQQFMASCSLSGKTSF